MDRLRDDRGCVDRDEHVVIRQHVPVEVQVDADLKHRERRSLRGIDQRSAERAVERIKGVRAIAEKIEVRYPGHKKTSDDEIAERALSIIRRNVQVPPDSVKVKVENGWVTLTGTVDWQFQRKMAETATRGLSGVVSGSNLIEVKPRVAPRDVKQKILNALKRNAELEADAIRVNVIEGKVVLEGKVKAWHERGLAEHAAWSAPGVRAVQDDLAIG